MSLSKILLFALFMVVSLTLNTQVPKHLEEATEESTEDSVEDLPDFECFYSYCSKVDDDGLWCTTADE